MRTKSFLILIAVISLLSLLLATSALVIAKKPDKPPEYPPLIATFDDGEQYALTSDGQGPYTDAIARNDFTIYISTGDRFSTVDRWVNLDLSRCASETCTGPYDVETVDGYYYLLGFQNYATHPMMNMEPGTTDNVSAVIYKKLNRHETLHLENRLGMLDPWGDTQVEAFDKDGDGTTDQWVFTCPEDAVWTADIHGKGNKVIQTDSEFYIPYKVTVDLP